MHILKVITKLKNNDPAIRIEAVKELANIGDSKAIELLIKALKDKNDPRAVVRLIEFLKDKNIYVRNYAEKALIEIVSEQYLNEA